MSFLQIPFFGSNYSSSTGPELPVMSGLVAWYDATETSSYPGSGTSWFDLSPNAGTGTIVNSPTFNSTTKKFTFNGTNNRVDIPTFLPAGQQTWTYFVCASLASEKTCILFGQGASPELTNRRANIVSINRVGSTSDTWGFNGVNNDKQESSGTFIGILYRTNRFTSFAIGMDTQASTRACSLYSNGTLYTTSNTGSGASNLNMGATAARIGCNVVNGEFWPGDIGVCIAYNRKLSDSEITSLHNYYANKYTFDAPY